MRRVLVTGSTGFIGGWVKKTLSTDYIVLSPSSRELNLLNENEVECYVKDNDVDVIIHCAIHRTLGLGEKAEQYQLRNNLKMFCNIYRLQTLVKRIIYIGSGAEFSNEHYIPSMSEEYFDNYVPKDDYGLSKYIMNLMAENSQNVFNLRVFGVYGIGENINYRYISNTICKLLKNTDIVIKNDKLFDYIYIEDLCQIIAEFLCIEPKYHSYNACTGNPVKISEIARYIKEKIGSEGEIAVLACGEGYYGDNSRLMMEINPIKFKSIFSHIDDMIDYYSKNSFELEGDY